jgi:hypothetical protein
LCYATPQESDIIIYNGERYSLFVNPMEEYFYEHPDRYTFEPLITTNWRGYIATFKIIQNEFFVIRIDVNGANVTKECLDGLDKMKVNWYSGLLVIPYGELIEYVHLGYASIYEHYKLIEIRNGNFIKEYYLNGNQYKIFREADFELWRNTKEYTEISKEYDFEIEPKKI